MKSWIVCLFALAALHPCMAASTDSLEFMEGFAWGDRSQALEMLVPGTEEYFYLHALDAQLRGDRNAYQETMDRWLANNRHSWNERMKELKRRQMLIDYDRHPKETWNYLRDDLNLRFQHHRRDDARNPDAPSRINPSSYGISVFMEQAFRHRDLDRFTDRGLELALARDLNPDQRRSFLNRLQRPDVPNLVNMVADDLDYKDSRGFGSLGIHTRMTTEQLVELARLRPAVLREDNYIQARLARILPPDVPLEHDHQAAIAYYRDLWQFARELDASQNSLKAAILYQLLEHLRITGVYDEALFRTYLDLPRAVAYMPEDQRKDLQRRQTYWVNFSWRPQGDSPIPSIGNEEPLVRDYLLTLLADDESTDSYAEYFEARWLNAVFAESKILAGNGKPKTWAGYLSPDAYRAILDRIEIRFAHGNPDYIKPGDAVSLDVDIKGVDRMLVKVFEIQTFNYYTTYRTPVDQAVDLDGMTASEERVMTFDEPKARRTRHTLSFPGIRERGVYVVELIGNGVSSRALIHVGHLETITRPTAAGHAVMVLNDEGDAVMNATVWMEGREFRANDKGLILLPYSEKEAAGVQFLVLRDGAFSYPDQMMQLPETYTFRAGIHLDPQNTLRHRMALLTLRPDLRVNGIPIDPSRVTNVTVTLTSVDARGTRTDRDIPATFELDREWTRPFFVPEGVRRFEVQVRGSLTRTRDGETVDLADSFTMDINAARATDTIRQVYLMPADEGWVLEIRGINGETYESVPLSLELYHPGFREPVHVRAASDADGRVYLGPLNGLSRIRAAGPDNLNLDMGLPGGAAVLPPVIHASEQQAITLPRAYNPTPGLTEVSLWKINGGTILHNAADAVEVQDGHLTIQGLTEGDYRLTLHETGQTLDLKVRTGNERHGFLFGSVDRLQATPVALPFLESIRKQNDHWTVAVANRTPSTRVLVRASRFADASPTFPIGGGYIAPSFRKVYPPHVQYVSGRNIGDEYRYVLDRRDRDMYAGSLLDRPGLILNPWELRETHAERETLKKDEAYKKSRQNLNVPTITAALAEPDAKARPEEATFFSAYGYAGGRGQPVGGIGYDFLPNGSAWIVDLEPDDNGRVEIPISELGDENTLIEIYLLDRQGTARYMESLSDRRFTPRDQRLTAGLDPDRSFSRQKRIRILQPGDTVTFADLGTTSYDVISTIGEAYELLRTLGGEELLNDFAFLKRWPGMDEEEKRNLYNEFACHELHLFLMQHDPDFFQSVVMPYLRNKKDKTFVDRWLLDELLPDDTRMDHLQERNAMETALLALRGGDSDVMQAAMREAWELLPPDPEAEARRFRTALQAGALDEERASYAERQRTAQDQSETIRTAETRDFQSPLVMKGLFANRSASGRMAMPAAAPAADFGSREMVMDEVELEEIPDLMAFGDDVFGGEITQLYRALPRTKEWVEQNYYKVRRHDESPALIPVNAFWRDVAAGLSLSPHLLEAAHSHNEVLSALAFTALPFTAMDPEESIDGARMTLTAATPCMLVSEEVLPAEQADDDRPLLLSQQVFRPDDAYRYEGNEQIEKYVEGEFIRRVVYGARVTLTNPTATRRRLNVLLQIPMGAAPLRNGFYTDDRPVTLEPYTTETIEYFFYFPDSGTFGQYPAHASADEDIAGRTEARTYVVVDAPTDVDRTSWTWISQNGENEEVITYLTTHNLRRTNLDDIAWRMKDTSFFHDIAELLDRRAMFQDTLLSYSLFHEDAEWAQTWLSRSAIVGKVGPVLNSPLLTVDPVRRRMYEHLEYDPLVNPRVHPVGSERKILNKALDHQYRSFLAVLMYKPDLDPHDKLELAYYLQLQDRLGEAEDILAGIQPRDLHEKLQYRYLQAWMALRTLDADAAMEWAREGLDHPVPRWADRFQALALAIREARGEAGDLPDDPNRQQELDRAASQQPFLDLVMESGALKVTAMNLPEADMNLYPMDIELLFSRKPFLTADGGGFDIVKPAWSEQIALNDDGESHTLELPEAFRDRNLMVELQGKGKRVGTAWLANRLRIRVIEEYGRIDVFADDEGLPLPRTYIKVYARGVDGTVSFWKDGYTDLRGRFDYVSLNDRNPEEAAEFSILILHPERGAAIREARPPMR